MTKSSASAQLTLIFQPCNDSIPEDEQKVKAQEFLSSLLGMENLLVLAGSGTSLTFNKEGENYVAPSMWDLWNACEESLDDFEEVKELTNYDSIQIKKDKHGESIADIELLLSLVDQYLLFEHDETTHTLLDTFKKSAIDKIFECTNFVQRKSEQLLAEQWSSHQQFVNKLGLRKIKQSRLKIFTTNYDMAFEQAASNEGFIVIDGFDFGQPQRFNPMWYEYDIVRRADHQGQNGSYLENVIHLYKLHGSCDWRRRNGEVIKTITSSTKGEKVIIYPSSNKYKSSYDSPYLDMISSFTQALKQSNTALICVGYGFNDEHLNNAITMALRTNTSLHLLAVSPSMFERNDKKEDADVNKHPSFKMLHQLVSKNQSKRVGLLAATFNDFVDLIPAHGNQNPDLKALKDQMATLLQGAKND